MAKFNYIKYNLVDELGFYIEEALLLPYEPVSEYHILQNSTEGLYKPKWDFENLQWIEGAIQEEIDIIDSNKTPLNSYELDKGKEKAMRDVTQTANMVIIQDIYSKLGV